MNSPHRPARRWLAISITAAAALLVAAFALLMAHWPFRREKVEQSLREAFSADVRIGKLTKLYFPHPGCVAEDVAIGGDAVKARKITIHAAYQTLFQRLELLEAEGLVVRIPADGGIFKRHSSHEQKRTLAKFVADGLVLQIQTKDNGGGFLQFVAPQLRMGPLGPGKTTSFTTLLEIPRPPGEITANGQFGPYTPGSTDTMPVSGSYSFRHANLGVFEGVAGTLSSDGKFHGPLARIEVDGSSDLPNFELTSARHPVHLMSNFHAIVNGTNGDTTLQPAQVRLQRTGISARGDISGRKQESGKTVAVDMNVHRGRIEDLLKLVLKSPRPPVYGEISLHARAVVPPEDEKFLRKLRLQGDFGIGGAHFASPKTQNSVDVLSERARGEKDDGNPEDVISNLKGHVTARNGVAQLSNLSFGVPGAIARLNGTYNLLNEHINLQGTLTMEATVSQANRGIKSFLLKAVDPFFKKKGSRAGAVIPIKITGTYSHPTYGLALGAKR